MGSDFADGLEHIVSDQVFVTARSDAQSKGGRLFEGVGEKYDAIPCRGVKRVDHHTIKDRSGL